MPTTLNTILKEALELTPMDKARLIDELLASFEFEGDKSIKALWADEAESRVEAFEKGEINARPVNDVFKDINKLK